MALSNSITNTTTIPEILAPVGGREQFFAALNAGADAVFLGLKQFNARARAENFTVDDLRSLVPLARRYEMRVLVTLNILVKDIELEELIRTLAELEDVGVHAIIVQDLGVARIARQYFPSLRLHASTQMAIHNLAGIYEAMAYGFKRLVLARELTAEEIKRMRRAIPREDIELEVFCHGSLCYSYSGLCFFSGAADARSGNRGECAYTCREPYKVVSEPGHGFLFSMRDLDTSHKLDQMVAAGVDTLKIEGRKKDAQYVTSVVRLYRKNLDQYFGRSTLRPVAPPMAREALASESEIRRDLKLSFQRQTTSFFFEGRYHENVIDLNNPTHHGLRVGIINKIQGKTLTVDLEDQIELHDGLKIMPADKLFHAKPVDGDTVVSTPTSLSQRYENREIAFALKNLSLKGRPIFEAARGMIVDIDVASFNGPGPEVGDVLFKTRSDDLRRRIDKMVGVPVDARLRPLTPVQAIIKARRPAGSDEENNLDLTVLLLRGQDIVAQQSLVLPAVEERQKGDFTSDLKDVFHIFGDEGVYVDEFSFQLDGNYFLPKSQLKILKRSLEKGLAEAATAVSVRHMNQALDGVLGEEGASTGASARLAMDHESSFSIKIDRLDYLPWIAELVAEGLPLREIVFEPKRMFLPDLKPQAFIDQLRQSAVPVRVAFPTVMRAWDEPVLKLWFEAFNLAGFNAFEIGNPGALHLIREWNLPRSNLASDFTLYAMNREAVRHWTEQGVAQMALSIEDDFNDLSSLINHWPTAAVPEVILYKDTPLFVAEACSLTALHQGCPTSAVCGYRTLEIENSKGERFFVAHEGCKSIVYGKTAYAISGHRASLEQLGVRRFRLDFLTRAYTENDFKAVVRGVLADQIIRSTHSANFLGRLK